MCVVYNTPQQQDAENCGVFAFATLASITLFPFILDELREKAILACNTVTELNCFHSFSFSKKEIWNMRRWIWVCSRLMLTSTEQYVELYNDAVKENKKMLTMRSDFSTRVNGKSVMRIV